MGTIKCNQYHNIKVYFEIDGYAELVATFDDTDLFDACMPIIKKEAGQRLIMVERYQPIEYDFEQHEFKTWNEAPYGDD